MKKISLVLTLGSLMVFMNCSENPESECIVCESFAPDIVLDDDTVCIGDDDGNGGTIALVDLKEAKRFFDAIDGVECTLK